MSDCDGRDLHIAADHDAAGSLVDDDPCGQGHGHHVQFEDLPDEMNRIVEVLARHLDLDIHSVDGLGNRPRAALEEQLRPVDHFRHLLGDAKSGVLRLEDQRELAVADVPAGEFLLQSAARVNLALGPQVGGFDGDVAFGNRKHLAVGRGDGTEHVGEHEPPAGQVGRGPHRADHAIDPVSLARAGGRDRGRDVHQGGVLCALELGQIARADRSAHAFHDDGEAANRRREVAAVSGPLQADNQPHGVKCVLLLPLDAAERSHLGAGRGGLDQQAGKQDRQSDNRGLEMAGMHGGQTSVSPGLALPIRTVGSGREFAGTSRGDIRRGRGRPRACKSAAMPRPRSRQCCSAGCPRRARCRSATFPTAPCWPG